MTVYQEDTCFIFRKVEFDFYNLSCWIKRLTRLEELDPEIADIIKEMKEQARLYPIQDDRRECLKSLASRPESLLKTFNEEFPV